MSVPKRRKAHGEIRQRRSHHHLKKSALVTCPKCSATKRPHFACQNCGFYGGKQVLDIETKNQKKIAKAKKKKVEREKEGK